MHLLLTEGSLCSQMPSKRPGSSVSRRVLVSRTVSFSPSRTLTSAQLITPTQTLSHAALIDSGADESFIDWRLAKRLGLNFVPLLRPLVAKALDGRLLCRVTHRTRPLKLIIANGHTESLSFHLFNSPSHPLILGYPWLVKHNPHMDWSTGRVLGWHKDCLALLQRDLCPPPM